MADGMRAIRGVLGRAIVAGLAAEAAGVVVLLADSLSEVLADPSLSIVDGYWIGRLPWTAIGVGLVVAGSTLALVSGTFVMWLLGGVFLRILSALAFGAGTIWWVIAFVGVPAGGAYCPSCPPPGPDPIAVAYSLPESVALLLMLPSLVAAVAAWTAMEARKPG
jgi:hypothetical protein